MNISELINDQEFRKAWPYVWSRLQKYLVQRQQNFARERKGKHEEIGQYVDFMGQIFDDLNQIDQATAMPAPPTRPRLNNSILDKTPPQRPTAQHHASSTSAPVA